MAYILTKDTCANNLSSGRLAYFKGNQLAGTQCPIVACFEDLLSNMDFKAMADDYIKAHLMMSSSLQQIGDECMERMTHLCDTLCDICKRYDDTMTRKAVTKWVKLMINDYKDIELLAPIVHRNELCELLSEASFWQKICQSKKTFCVDYLYLSFVWYIYVYVLLKLKRIENDDNNGFQVVIRRT